MYLHILIVISCVFLASLFSWVILNRFFRRKTFDEVLAEKKALSDKIYAQSKTTIKKPKKSQPSKRDQKREKKQQRQKEEKNKETTEHDDSDTQSEKPSADEEAPTGLSKTHVEFDPDPEVLNYENDDQKRRQSNSDKEIISSKHKVKKEKKVASTGKTTVTGGILHNKNEPVAIKSNITSEESLNNFEAKPPKDIVELKRSEKERKEDKTSTQQNVGKKEKHTNKKEKAAPAAILSAIEQTVDVPHTAVKELKQQEERVRQTSPKNQQNGQNNTSQKNKQHKKQAQKESVSAATREIVQALDKLSESDTIGVQLLMNLFRRAELNRSEIQILIDYLLNKQQDMPASHSEWSDDICQKLKRQLEEKERALTEEQKASIGIQAKLRDLRTEVNSERLQMNANIKVYTERILSKDQEIAGLNQELQTVNEKFNLERQQFQAKLAREKQAGSQELLAQIQMMQGEITHKDKCINELTCLVNNSRQAIEESNKKNEIIQSQAQQIAALEQQRENLEQVSNNRIFELEKTKELETENSEIKVELRNLQNAFESSKAELNEQQQQMQKLQVQNGELLQQLTVLANKKEEFHSKEQAGMQATLDALRIELAEKEKQLTEFVSKNTELFQQSAASVQIHEQKEHELQQRIETLTRDAASKHKQLQDVERTNCEKYMNREKELLQQLQEQKEINNDLRKKTWKLVEALQNAETTITENKSLSKQNANIVQQQQQFHAVNSATTSITTRDEKHVRDMLQRLYPEAVKASAGTALSLPLDQWIEQVLATHVKQFVGSTPAVSNSNKSTQSNNSNGNHNSVHNAHNNNLLISESSTTTSKHNSSRSSNNGSESSSNAECEELNTQNAQLRIQVDELKRLLKKTSKTLTDIEEKALEQDENWRSIVRSKDEQIHALQHSNGEQDI